MSTILIRKEVRDFSGGPVVKNPPSNAEDAGSIPGQGTNIPRAEGQLSPHAATTEPTRSGARAAQPGRSPRAAAKSPRTARRDPAYGN